MKAKKEYYIWCWLRNGARGWCKAANPKEALEIARRMQNDRSGPPDFSNLLVRDRKSLSGFSHVWAEPKYDPENGRY